MRLFTVLSASAVAVALFSSVGDSTPSDTEQNRTNVSISNPARSTSPSASVLLTERPERPGFSQSSAPDTSTRTPTPSRSTPGTDASPPPPTNPSTPAPSSPTPTPTPTTPSPTETSAPSSATTTPTPTPTPTPSSNPPTTPGPSSTSPRPSDTPPSPQASNSAQRPTQSRPSGEQHTPPRQHRPEGLLGNELSLDRGTGGSRVVVPPDSAPVPIPAPVETIPASVPPVGSATDSASPTTTPKSEPTYVETTQDPVSTSLIERVRADHSWFTPVLLFGAVSILSVGGLLGTLWWSRRGTPRRH